MCVNEHVQVNLDRSVRSNLFLNGSRFDDQIMFIPAREARGITKCVGSNPVTVRASVRACVRASVRPHYSGGDL